MRPGGAGVYEPDVRDDWAAVDGAEPDIDRHGQRIAGHSSGSRADDVAGGLLSQRHLIIQPPAHVLLFLYRDRMITGAAELLIWDRGYRRKQRDL